MKPHLPGIAQTARLLLHSGDGVTGSSSLSSTAVCTALKATAQYTTSTAAAAAQGRHPGAASAPAGAADATPPPPPAATGKTPSTADAVPAPDAAPTGSSSTASSSSSSKGGSAAGGEPGNNNSKKGRGSWLTTAAIVALPAGAYYAYEQSKQQYANETGEAVPDLQKLIPPGLVPESIGNLFRTAKQTVSNVIPSQLSDLLGQVGAADKAQSAKDQLHSQKQKDAEELGFTMLPPEEAAATAVDAAAAATTAAAAIDGGEVSAAAAGDLLTAAADEFPGSSSSSGEAVQAAAQQGAAPEPVIEHIDMTPIHALFGEVGPQTGLPDVTAAAAAPAAAPVPHPAAAAPSPQALSSKAASAQVAEQDASRIVAAMAAVAAASEPEQQQQQTATQPAPAAAAHATPATADASTVAVKDQSDSELERLCKQLGLSEDLSPAGLIAVANALGLGALSSTGTPLQPQMVQLNQATADARLVGTLLQQLASRQGQLQQELRSAQQQAAWAEEAAKKREESLTEHFKELMREQSRIHQQITADAVRRAEEVVVADTAKAHNEERRQRGAVIDELRAKVNALSLAFDQRTAQVKSAHEVHKISLGVLALSKALEEGRPIGEQLQLLATGCPDDPIVEAVEASLPASAATSGLPTLQQLQQQFKAVARDASEAAYFTADDEGGVLARLAAKLAVQLKLDAASVEGPDSKIAQAKAFVQQGKLLAAADALSAAAAGTQAAAVVASWVENARARAVADQAVKLLQAHATTTAVAAGQQ